MCSFVLLTFSFFPFFCKKKYQQWQGSNLHPSDPKSNTLPLHHWRSCLLSSLSLFIYLSSFQLPCVCLCVFKRDCVRAYVLLCYSSSFFVFVFWYKLRNTFLAFWVYCLFICIYPGNQCGLSQGMAPVRTLVGALRWISEKLNTIDRARTCTLLNWSRTRYHCGIGAPAFWVL